MVKNKVIEFNDYSGDFNFTEEDLKIPFWVEQLEWTKPIILLKDINHE